MELINIYIINTIKRFSGGWGYVGYILEAFRNNIPVTVQGFFKIKDTPNRADMLIIIEAMGRLTKPCDVHIHTRNKQIFDAYDKCWIEEWKKNGWKNSRGEEVRNGELWKLLSFLNKGSIQIEYGKHSYYEWMERYIRENEREIEVVGDEQEKQSV